MEAHHADELPRPSGATIVDPSPGEQGTLVVVDYAERWPATDLLRLVQAPALRPRPRTRVLLLARPAGHWWHTLAFQLNALPIGLDVDPVADQVTLSPLAPSALECRAVFDAARDAFATALGVLDPHGIAMPSWLDSHGHALTIHMAALAAVDAHARGVTTPADPASLSSYLIARERAHWRAMHGNGHGPIRTPDTTMARLVFVAALTRPQPHSAAVEVLHRASLATTAESAAQLLDDHAACYPPAEAESVLEPLYPDRLAEDLVALQTPGSDAGFPADPWAAGAWDQLLVPDEDGTPPRYARAALINLIEAAHRWPHLAQRHLFPLLRAYPRLALVAGGAALVRLAGLPDIDVEMLFEIEAVFPERHLDLDPGMAALTERLVAETAGSIIDPHLSASLHRRLSRRLYAVGRSDDALWAIEQAVEILRSLVWEAPEEYMPDLSWTLMDYGACLADLGRYEDAIGIAEDAVWFRRQLVEFDSTLDSQIRLPELAASLGSLGNLLMDQGRWDEAHAATEEAVALLRPVSEDEPDLFEPDLALGLTNLGRVLANLDRSDEALAVTEEAVLAWRRGAAALPETYEPDLGWALSKLGQRLTDVARWDDALAATTESVELLRHASEVQPAGYRANFAAALEVHDEVLNALGDRPAALAAAVEVVEVRRLLATPHNIAGEFRLGGSLLTFSYRLSAVSRADAALAAAVEATEIFRRVVVGQPEVYESQLAHGYQRLSEIHAALGDRSTGLAMAEQAVELARRHEAEDPVGIAYALLAYSDQLTYQGRAADASTAAREALDLLERRADGVTSSQAAEDLSWALNALATTLVKSSRADAAVVMARRAITTLTNARPRTPYDSDVRLAGSMDTLSVALAASDQADDALAAAEEGVRLLRGLVARSTHYEPDLVLGLTNLAQRQADLGRWEDACATTAEAVGLRRALFAIPGCEATASVLARSLWQYAYIRVAAGVRLSEAVAAAAEALALHDQLPPAAAETFASERRGTGITLAGALEAAGRFDEASRIRLTVGLSPNEESDVPAEW